MATLYYRIRAVYEMQKALREAVERVGGYDQWLFCVHTHYEQPRVSVWEKDSDIHEKKPATFVLNDDGWQLLDIGGYGDAKSEVEAAFKVWLAH